MIVKNERFDIDGTLIAVAQLGNYGISDGLIFPLKVEAHYPTEETYMLLEMRNLRPNTDLDEKKYFDIQARARELRLL